MSEGSDNPWPERFPKDYPDIDAVVARVLVARREEWMRRYYEDTQPLAGGIEQRWQAWWDEHGTFETPNPTGLLGDAELADERGDKLFVLDMFPYPSGNGLHVGHPEGSRAARSEGRPAPAPRRR